MWLYGNMLYICDILVLRYIPVNYFSFSLKMRLNLLYTIFFMDVLYIYYGKNVQGRLKTSLHTKMESDLIQKK